MAKDEVKVYMQISGILFHTSRNLFFDVLKKQIVDEYAYRLKENVETDTALSAYLICVSAWEAFFNESIYDAKNYKPSSSSPYWEMVSEIDRWDISHKAYIVPKLLFGVSFDKGGKVFQDFVRMVKIRNSIVHYKMIKEPEQEVKDLISRNLALDHHEILIPWNKKIATSECFRWCINTVAEMIQEFSRITPNAFDKQRVIHFKPISLKEVHDAYKEVAIDFSLDNDTHTRNLAMARETRANAIKQS